MPEPDELTSEQSSRTSMSGRRYAGFFVLVESVAFVVYAVLGRSLWFRLDEWQFLAVRTAWGKDSLLAPHGWVHPQMLPVLAYRLLWWFVGLRSYEPYLFVIIAMHLTCAFLIRWIMLRSGVRAWAATLVATAFVCFGTGYQCIVWPFQIGYVGSVMFGLAHLLFADHDGAWDKRDTLGMIAGLASLACSAVGVTMVLVIGVSTFVRRGWRLSLMKVGALGAAYVLWFELFARKTYSFGRSFGFIQPRTPMQTIQYAVRGTFNTLHDLGQSTALGVVLGVFVLVGLILAWRRVASPEVRTRMSMPFALASGMVVYLLFTGYGHQGGTTESRYVYIDAAFLMPAVGVAASALADRARALGAIIVAALVIGIPGNIHSLTDYVHKEKSIEAAFKNMMLTLPRVPLARQLPGKQIPITGPYSKPGYVTADWLTAGVESGRIPRPQSKTPVDIASATLRWALRDAGGCFAECGPSHKVPKGYTCTNVAQVTLFRVSQGTRILVKGGIVFLSPPIGPLRGAYPLDIQSGNIADTLVARARVSFRVTSSSHGAAVCTRPLKRAPSA